MELWEQVLRCAFVIEPLEWSEPLCTRDLAELIQVVAALATQGQQQLSGATSVACNAGSLQ